MLRVDNDQDSRRFAPLAAPGDPRGVLRAAYSVPLTLLRPETRFWLEHGDGSLTELPAPTPDAGRAGSQPAAATAGRPQRLVEAELLEARERAARAEAENEQLAATLAELDIWRGELERRLTATTTELGSARAALEADGRELERLRAALDQAQAQLELRAATVDSSGSSPPAR